MARYTGPKRRLSRREGLALTSKDAAYIERKGATPPGMRGTKMRRRLSDYGVQLREKQKAKRFFGLLEKQFRKVFDEASKSKGATGIVFLQSLESRLDNVIYRLGLAKSRNEARQMVSHGHVTVNGEKVDIPSYKTGIDDIVAISEKFVHNTQVKRNLAEQATVPGWLEKKGAAGKVLRAPERDEMESSINEQLIVEYYSR